MSITNEKKLRMPIEFYNYLAAENSSFQILFKFLIVSLFSDYSLCFWL